jgi:copper transport protein
MRWSTRAACCVALATIVLLLLVPARTAEAHAQLEAAEPQPGATLDAAPAAIVLRFSEPLDAGFTRVQLFDASGRLVAPGPGVIEPGAENVLRLALDDIPRGAYTAIWRARSTVDGHVTEGNVPFGVGVPPALAYIPPPGTPEPATLPPGRAETVVRWLSLLAAALAGGGPLFMLAVWRPLVPAGRADRTLTLHIRRLTVGGGLALVVASLLFVIVQTASAGGTSLLQAFGEPLGRMLASYTGLLIVARVILALALLALRLPPQGEGGVGWWLAAGLAGSIALSFALGSHAGGLDMPALAVALAWLHNAAMVAWLGGLLPLALAVRVARNEPEAVELTALVPRFSRLALASVVVLAFTGAYAAWQHVGRLDLLAATTYGRALGLKLALFGVLLGFGAMNLLWLTPRLPRAAGGLSRSLGGELLAGAVLLLVVGALTSVAPARVAWAEQQRLGQRQTAALGDVDLTLRVAPAWIGDNEFAVDVRDQRPGAEGAPTQLLLDFTMEGMTMGTLRTAATPVGDGRYVARGSYVAMGGRWRIEVLLRRAGFDDVRHVFTVDILRSAG